MGTKEYSDSFVAQLFMRQPQPAFLMTPVFDENNSVIDFEYSYCNDEMFLYSGQNKESFIGSKLFNSPVLQEDNLRLKYFHEILNVYNSGERVSGTIFNTKFKKYYGFIREKVGEGVLTILQDRNNEYQLINQLEKQAEELEAQRNLLNNILKHSPSGITVSEAIRNNDGELVDWRTIVANQAAEMVTGRSKEDMIKGTIKETDPALWESPLSKAGVETLRTGQPFITRHFFEQAEKWLEVSVAKMDEDHLINVFTDITEIKLREQEIEHSEKMLKDIVETQLNIVGLFSPVFDNKDNLVDFKLRMLNKAAEKYTRVNSSLLNGQLLSQLFSNNKHLSTFEKLKEAYLTKKPQRFDFDYKGNELKLYFDILATPLQNDLMVCIQDMTESKQFQSQLEKSVDELKRSNIMLEEFAYASSHDLKEPIRKIRSFSDRLKTRLISRLEDDEKQMFERLERSAQRMELLVEDLLAYSHVSHFPVEFEQINMNEKLKRILEDLELQISEKQATVNIGPLPTITGHRRQIQQLFQNLISNSLKYSKADVSPVIDLSTKTVTGNNSGLEVRDEDRNKLFHLFEIKDNGIGFEQKYAKKIFQMFQRLHGKSEFSGTGVGLSIVKKVVDNHGGYITAFSNPGEGATFLVLLPAQ